jgi:prephenate dehydratase
MKMNRNGAAAQMNGESLQSESAYGETAHGETLPETPARQFTAQPPRRIAIQGERGSNSHMAVLAMLGEVEVVPCSVSGEVIEAVVSGRADAAVLPIENSLHGSVAEHYDLLLEQKVRIDGESLLRVRHNLIGAPGMTLRDVKTVISHPVALSQCRKFLAEISTTRSARVMPFYDTAGSVKHLMSQKLRDTAAVAPVLAAREYGAEVLVSGIEDHAQNFTRFHLLRRMTDPQPPNVPPADKLSLAFAVEHRKGTLVTALQGLSDAGADLTKIESRPVPGRPWEYVFYVDLRYVGEPMAERALASLRDHCGWVKELGRYAAA